MADTNLKEAPPRLVISVDRQTYTAIASMAKESERSLSQQCRLALKQFVKRESRS
jgi:hypothetical protein